VIVTGAANRWGALLGGSAASNELQRAKCKMQNDDKRRFLAILHSAFCILHFLERDSTGYSAA
jgi:hypothetical protein